MFFSFKTVGKLQVIHQLFPAQNKQELGIMLLAEKLDWKGLKAKWAAITQSV
jgi:hypothetical protein